MIRRSCMLSKQVSEFEKGLFVDLEELLDRIKERVRNKKPICFIMATYYNIIIEDVDAVDIDDWSCEKVCSLDFYKNDKTVFSISIPKDKLYRNEKGMQYIEIIEGIDYEKDKYIGKCVRVH